LTFYQVQDRITQLPTGNRTGTAQTYKHSMTIVLALLAFYPTSFIYRMVAWRSRIQLFRSTFQARPSETRSLATVRRCRKDINYLCNRRPNLIRISTCTLSWWREECRLLPLNKGYFWVQSTEGKSKESFTSSPANSMVIVASFSFSYSSILVGVH
jgi:hypothetical protein